MRAGVGLVPAGGHLPDPLPRGTMCSGCPACCRTIGCQGRTRPLLLTGPRGLGAVLVRHAGAGRAAALPGAAGRDGVRRAVVRGRGPKCAPSPTRHRVPSQGYADFLLPRAGRFDPARARSLGVPLKLLEAACSREKRCSCPEALWSPSRSADPSGGGSRWCSQGNTAPCPALEAAARDADLLICDATYAEDELASEAAKYGHSTFRQSAELAVRAGVRRLWLAHYSPRIEDPEAFLPLVQSICPAAGVRPGRQEHHPAL